MDYSEHPQVPGAHLKDYDPDPHRGEEIDFKSPGERAPAESPSTVRFRAAGFFGGLLAAIAVYFLIPAEIGSDARLTGGTAVLLGIWWMTEALPIPATALVPLVVFPVGMSDVKFKDVGASYGNDIIFLFMGGFLLALAMQRWNLHRRIALVTVRLMGTTPTHMIGGFMLATAFLSMWVSNTATAVMMLPIGVSVLMLVTKVTTPGALDGSSDAVIRTNFGSALMLGIAYAASIGSLGTVIGTPPNTLLVGYLRDNEGITVGFGQWMLVGVPLACLLLVITWFLLVKVLFRPEIKEIPGGRQLIDDELHNLGPMSLGEKQVLGIFLAAAAAWVAVPLIWSDNPPISDAGIAVLTGLILFILPSGTAWGVRLLDWESAVKLPWGVLLLFGGGLALSAQFSASGLTKWIGSQVTSVGALPSLAVVIVICSGVIFLTELTSNTATAATFLPVAGGIALGMDLPPMLLAVPVALAATCAFMLPVATPPNAIAFGSGYTTVAQMVKGGFWLNLCSIVLISVTTMTLVTWVFHLG